MGKMAAASTNIKIDPELKRQAQDLFKDLGLNLTSAITLFLTQSVREQAIPFRVGKNVPNSETVKALEEGESILKSGKSRFKNSDEMFDDLGM